MAYLVALFLCVGMVWGGSNTATLRIASFNLEWLVASADENRMDPWNDEASLEKHRHDLARILAKDVHADVVCVLESTSELALKKLVAKPELKSMGYRIYHLESEDVTTGQDVAFLVRVPLDRVVGKEFHDFRQESRDPLTKRAIIYLTAGKLKLGILGLHFLAHPDDAYRNRKRAEQAGVAARLIREEIVARGYTPIVLGDLNDFDNRKVIHILKDFDRKKPGDELFNSAEKIQPATERYSTYWDLNKNGRWDAGEPTSLIDHILLDKSLSTHLVKAEILHVPKDGSVSDHWPVVVELTL